jgi:hypothetical protein
VRQVTSFQPFRHVSELIHLVYFGPKAVINVEHPLLPFSIGKLEDRVLQYDDIPGRVPQGAFSRITRLELPYILSDSARVSKPGGIYSI